MLTLITPLSVPVVDESPLLTTLAGDFGVAIFLIIVIANEHLDV